MSAGRNKSKERGELPRVGEVEEFGRGKRSNRKNETRKEGGTEGGKGIGTRQTVS